MQKPVDHKLQDCMWDAAKHLCMNIQGAKLAYIQSDEISVLVTDYEQRNTEGWFDYQIQKMASVAASLATGAFYKKFMFNFPDYNGIPAFDARVYNVPIHEVNNYMIWRQQDATRNSISSLAQANFSHKQLHGVDCDAMQEMLFSQKGINWNDDCPTEQKRGVCFGKLLRKLTLLTTKPEKRLRRLAAHGKLTWRFQSSLKIEIMLMS